MSYTTAGNIDRYSQYKAGILQAPEVLTEWAMSAKTEYATQNNQILTSGLYAYVRQGEKLSLHYTDAEGKNRLKIEKGKTEIPGGEFLGRTTGRSGSTPEGRLLIQVTWTNVYNQNKLFGLLKDLKESEVTSYVLSDQIELRQGQQLSDVTYIPSGGNQPGGTNPGGSASDNTILYAAAGVAGAVLLTPKKRRKK